MQVPLAAALLVAALVPASHAAQELAPPRTAAEEPAQDEAPGEALEELPSLVPS